MTALETTLVALIPYKNTFFLDYGLEERKLTLKLLKEKDLLFAQNGEESLIHPLFEL